MAYGNYQHKVSSSEDYPRFNLITQTLDNYWIGGLLERYEVPSKIKEIYKVCEHCSGALPNFGPLILVLVAIIR